MDVAHDDAHREAGRQITCPVLVLWAARGGLPGVDPDVRGGALDAKHFLAENRPKKTAAELLACLADTRPADASQGENAAQDTLGV